MERRVKASCAAAAVAALAVSGAGLAAPANAESAPTGYTCTTPIGDQTFTVVADSNAPGQLAVGQARKIKLTSEVTIPESLSSLAYGVLQARSIDGTAAANGKIGSEATVANLTVPNTPVEATGDLVVNATGNAGTFKSARVGKYNLEAGDFTALLTFRNEGGDSVLDVNTVCTAPDGADLTYDTIKVVKDKTKIASVKVSKSVKKGKTASATVKVKSTHGLTPTGTVKMVVKKGSKTIQSKSLKLNKKGVAAAKTKKLTAKGAYTVVVQYKGSKNFAPSAKKVQKFSVK